MTSHSRSIPRYSGLAFRRRKKERLEKQIAVLETMDYAVWRKSILCSTATIAGLAALICGGLYYFAGMFSWWLPFAVVAGILVTLFLIRNWFVVVWLGIVVAFVAMIAMIFDGDPGTDFNTVSAIDDIASGLDVIEPSSEEKSKARRRIEQAIAKRQARLRRILGQGV
jgi:hypothetical protein